MFRCFHSSLITQYSKLTTQKHLENVKRLPLQPIRVFQTPLLCGRSKQRMKFVYSAALRRAVLRGWNFKIFHNFLFFAWVGNVPTLDIWGSATESRALFSREKCLRPRKYHFSAVRNARNWGNTIFQPWEMPATESRALFCREKCKSGGELKRISEDRIAIGKRERGYSVWPLRKKSLFLQ